MPDAWNDKRERQYEHIKESAKERGADEERAKEIAARTVNKERRLEGETKSDKTTTEGTGNPNVPLDQRTKDEVYNRAEELDIDGRSQMTKDELVEAVRARQG